MRTAHPSISRISNTYSDSFCWNRKSLDQFVFIDPSNEGWSAEYRAKDGNVPEHIEIRAPKLTSRGPVFLIVEKDVLGDHVVHLVHDQPRSAQIGSVSRYLGCHDYYAAVLDISGWEVYRKDHGVTEDIMRTCGAPKTPIVRNSVYYRGGLIGTKDTFCLADTPSYSDYSNKIGIIISLDPGKEDSTRDKIRIFDYYVERIDK